MRLSILLASAALMLGAAAPVSAQATHQPERSATELTVEGLEKLMRGLQRMIEELPRYDLPEITEDGDIILRRIDPHRQAERQPEPPQPSTPEGSMDL